MAGWIIWSWGEEAPCAGLGGAPGLPLGRRAVRPKRSPPRPLARGFAQVPEPPGLSFWICAMGVIKVPTSLAWSIQST